MQRRVLTVGDIHGKSIWKRFVFGSLEKFNAWKERVLNGEVPTWEEALDVVFSDMDEIVFVGDYFDSFTVSNVEMKANFLDILLFKKQYPEKVFVLWGNHDVHYFDSSYRCAGFRGEMYYDFHEIVAENSHLIDFAHQVGNVLWTHAGVTESFLLLCKNKYKGIERYPGETEELDITKLAEFLEEMWRYKWKPLFFAGHGRGGFDPVSGPLWADRWELSADPARCFHQFVGHTPGEQVESFDLETEGKKFTVAFVDTLERGVIKGVVIVNFDKNGEYVKYDVYEDPEFTAKWDT